MRSPNINPMNSKIWCSSKWVIIIRWTIKKSDAYRANLACMVRNYTPMCNPMTINYCHPQNYSLSSISGYLVVIDQSSIWYDNQARQITIFSGARGKNEMVEYFDLKQVLNFLNRSIALMRSWICTPKIKKIKIKREAGPLYTFAGRFKEPINIRNHIKNRV